MTRIARPATVLKENPGVRKDGRCAGKGCKKRLGPAAVKERDPWCSTLCCRKHHGVQFASDTARVSGVTGAPSTRGRGRR